VVAQQARRDVAGPRRLLRRIGADRLDPLAQRRVAVVRVVAVVLELLLEHPTDRAVDLLVPEEPPEALPHAGPDAAAQRRHELGVPVRVEGRPRGGDPPQRTDLRVAAGDLHGEPVGRELLAARHRGGDAHEELGVRLERRAHDPLEPAALAVLVPVQRADGAQHRLAGAVDPPADPRVAADVVAELVRDHRAQLVRREQLDERQPDDEDAALAHERRADLGDRGVDLGRQPDVVGHRVPDAARDVLDEREQLGLRLARHGEPRRLEAVAARDDREQDAGPGDDHRDADEDREAAAVAPPRHGQPDEGEAAGDGHGVEDDRQDERQDGAADDRRR
jgi:hypothetical protein